MAASNFIKNIAIVGAGGQSGRYMTEALLKTGRYTITAITRANGQIKLPQGITLKNVDYNNPETLVDALRNQDALVITLSGHAPKETEVSLINAAAQAGVNWILPNEWSPDTANEALVRDLFPFQSKVTTRKAITALGKSSYIAICTGFWYEQTLAKPAAFGIDFAGRTVTFFDEGDVKISTSTNAQVGRAVASLLSLPISASSREGSSAETCLEDFRNGVVYVKSFTVSQKDMLASAIRVTGTKETDWTVTKEPVKARFEGAIKELKEGNLAGFAKLPSRLFFPDGCGEFESGKMTLNGVLGLPEEDLDVATRAAWDRAKAVPDTGQ